MTQSIVSAVVGALISILLEVVPGLKDTWSDWRFKPLTLLVLFVAVPTVAWALACFGGINIPTPSLHCSVQGAVDSLLLGIVAFMASQSAYGLGVRNLPNAQDRQPQPGCSCD